MSYIVTKESSYIVHGFGVCFQKGFENFKKVVIAQGHLPTGSSLPSSTQNDRDYVAQTSTGPVVPPPQPSPKSNSAPRFDYEQISDHLVSVEQVDGFSASLICESFRRYDPGPVPQTPAARDAWAKRCAHKLIHMVIDAEDLTQPDQQGEAGHMQLHTQSGSVLRMPSAAALNSQVSKPYP